MLAWNPSTGVFEGWLADNEFAEWNSFHNDAAAYKATLASQAQALRDQIDKDAAAAQTAAQSRITEYENGVLSRERTLADSFLGFQKGILAPAYQTENANVLVRDPLRNQNGPWILAPGSGGPEKSILPLALAAGLFIYLWKKGTFR